MMHGSTKLKFGETSLKVHSEKVKVIFGIKCTTKACEGERMGGTASHILNFGTRCREVVSFIHWSLHSRIGKVYVFI